MKHTEIAASLIAADFTHLADEIDDVATADWLHLDVMDNHFVPNLGFSLHMVSRIAQTSPLPLDCHLMIEHPDRWAPRYAQAGAARVTFHVEAIRDAATTARAVREQGASPALAFSPNTNIAHHLDALATVDAVLAMTVQPGLGGQTFLPHSLANVRTATTWRAISGAKLLIGVDGGISASTVAHPARAGATFFVAGTAIFAAPDRSAAIAHLRRAAAAQ